MIHLTMSLISPLLDSYLHFGITLSIKYQLSRQQSTVEVRKEGFGGWVPAFPFLYDIEKDLKACFSLTQLLI